MILIVHCSDAVEIPQLDYMRLKVRKERWEDALTKHNKMDQITMIVSEYMLHQYLELEYGIQASAIEYDYNRYGKPQLRSKVLHFNLSHSGRWVAVAINDEEIGVDIEQAIPINYSFINHYFTEAEQSYVRSAETEDDQLSRFYEIWTCKESYLKMLGTGLSKSLTSFSIHRAEPSIEQYPHPSSSAYSTTILLKQFLLSQQQSLDEITQSIQPATTNIFHLTWNNVQLAICARTCPLTCSFYELEPSGKLQLNRKQLLQTNITKQPIVS